MEDLFETEGEEGKWYVLHTRPRCEKKAAGVCAEKQIRHYLPLGKGQAKPKKGQRRYSFDVPLFPGYAFACLNQNQRYELMSSGQLVRTIDIVNQGQFLKEIRQIYQALENAADLSLYPQLKRGKKVRVVRGALAGVEGLISQRKENFRLVLNLSILGQAVAAELSMGDVELC